MTLAFWIVAYVLSAFVYLVAVILIAKLLISKLLNKLLKRWNVPNWLSLLLSSVVFGLVLSILSVNFPNGSFRYFINPFGMNLTNAITYYAHPSDYFWVNLVLYAFFGVVIGTTYVYRFDRSSDFWRR